MNGNGLNRHAVSIDQSATIPRVVYGRVEILEAKMQVGFVLINDKYVWVWRPYDPIDKSRRANWRNGACKNFYTSRMHWQAEGGKVRMILESQNFGKFVVRLPSAASDLTGALKEYLGAVLT